MLSTKTLKKLEGIKKRARDEGYVRNLFQIANNSPDLWEQAYANICPNKGAMTAGIDNVTMDKHSDGRIEDLIMRLKGNRYKPQAVRKAKSSGNSIWLPEIVKHWYSIECHDLLHAGKLPDSRFMSKVESRVL